MSTGATAEQGQASVTARSRTALQFSAFLAWFATIHLLSWPIVFSLDLWILKDRGSFLNLDYLLEQHLRLGIDTFYSYGLLPVLLQHWLFVVFGKGYWPLLGCAAATMVLMALFCTLLLRYLPREAVWFIAVFAMSRIINTVNPNLPYSIVQLSILFALFFVLVGRLEVSLAVSAIGCWSVPSLPLVMTVLLAIIIVVQWSMSPSRSSGKLFRALLPGVLTYLGIGAVLAIEFGWKSVLATATPLEGMAFYKKENFGSGQALMQFLHPSGYSSSYYVAYTFLTPVFWWILSTLGLIALAIMAFRSMLLHRALDPRSLAIILCAAIQVSFALLAYGAPHQHYIFDPVLTVGVLLGLGALPKGTLRMMLLTLFLGFGIAGQAILVRATFQSWKEKVSPVTANLYAPQGWASEWTNILDLSKQRSLLLLSYSTGVHHYFPTVSSPEVWTLRQGELLPADKSRVLEQLDRAEVVVLDMTSPNELVETDPDIQRHLNSLCLTDTTVNFQVWQRPTTGIPDQGCARSMQRALER